MKTSEAVTYDLQAATEPCMATSEHTERTEKQHANNERVKPPHPPMQTFTITSFTEVRNSQYVFKTK
jgi:hypothetical protein